MQKNILLLLCICLMVLLGNSSRTNAQDNSPQTQIIGKWTQHYKGMELEGATMTITSVDSVTGQLKGKWFPPSGAAGGKAFDVIGWISSAPPRDKLDNVITISFSVSLTAYGSITSYTGYFRDNKITASWFNIKPNSTYEWDHISTGQDTFTKNP